MPSQQKIPQNIDIQDKIFGPFTLQQFLYMLGGGAIIYILFATIAGTNFLLFLLLSIPIALFTLALTLVRVNDRPFLTFLGYGLIYFLEPKIKVWRKSVRLRDVAIRSSEEVAQSRREQSPRPEPGAVRSRLSQLATVIDNRGVAGVDELGGDRVVDLTATGGVPTVDESRVTDIFSGVISDDERPR